VPPIYSRPIVVLRPWSDLSGCSVGILADVLRRMPVPIPAWHVDSHSRSSQANGGLWRKPSAVRPVNDGQLPAGNGSQRNWPRLTALWYGLLARQNGAKSPILSGRDRRGEDRSAPQLPKAPQDRRPLLRDHLRWKDRTPTRLTAKTRDVRRLATPGFARNAQKAWPMLKKSRPMDSPGRRSSFSP
jgi:hypothetical protein